ncbi:MAG: hypothetical protein RLZZ458_2873, partial [Planctomycetota bacterium]
QSVSIQAGADTDGAGITVFGGGGISVSNNSGSISLDSAGDIDLGGMIAAGGEILLIQNPAGETTGYNIVRNNGSASLSMNSDRRISTGQEIYAAQSIALNAGVAVTNPGSLYSGIGLVVQGNSSLNTGAANSEIRLSSQSGISLLTPSMPSSGTYNIYAPGSGSTVRLELAANSVAGSGLDISGRVLAERQVLISSADTVVNADVSVGPAGALEVTSSVGTLDVIASGQLLVNGSVTSGNDVSLTALSGDVSLASISRVDANGNLEMVASHDLLIDGAIGSVRAPASVSGETAGGRLSVATTTGEINAVSTVALSASQIEFNGVLRTTTPTDAVGDYEVTIEGDTLQLTGAMTIAGSLLVTAAATEMYNFTADLTSSDSRARFVSDGAVNVGRLTLNAAGKWISQSAVIQATAGIAVSAPAAAVTVNTGSALSTSGNNSSVVITAATTEIIGVVYAGARVNTDLTLVWTGTDGDVSITAAQIAIGGLGVCPCGRKVTKGGSVQSTGDILFRAMGEGIDSSFDVNSMSFIRTMPTGSESLPPITETASLAVLSDGNITVFGTLDGSGTGADLLLDAAGGVLLDGALKASDRMTVSSRSATAAIELSQLTLWTNSSGQLLNEDGKAIDRNGYLIDANNQFVDEDGNLLPPGDPPISGGLPVRLSGGTLNADAIQLTATADIRLLGQTGELSVVDNALQSGTRDFTANAAGTITVGGRQQTSQLIDLRGGQLNILPDALVLAENTVHLLGGTAEIEGFVASPGKVVLNATSSLLVTGTVQSGNRINVAAGVSAGWSLSQLTSDNLQRSQLAAGTVSIEHSGVLDAVNEIRVVSGGDFDLSADAVVTPNLSSITEPVIVQRQRTIDVVTGTRQVAAGTQTVDVISYVPTEVTEATGSTTVRVGTAYHTMDATLTQDGYYNGDTLREYFVQNVDYENESIAWTSYERLPLGLVRRTNQTPAPQNAVPAPEITATFAQLTDDQKSVVLAELGYLRLYRFSYTNARRHQTVNGNTTIIPWTPRWANDPLYTHNFAFPGLTDKYIILPEGAVQDFFQVVSQGYQALPVETVGQYRDRADVDYYQDRSRLTERENFNDYDQQTARWYVTAVPADPVIIDGEQQTVRNGRRQYEIFDGRVISGSGDQDRSLQHVYEPIWYESAPSDGNLDSSPLVGVDSYGERVMTPQGYLPDTAYVDSKIHVNTRPQIWVGRERLVNFSRFLKEEIVESTGGWWIPPASYGWTPGPSRLPSGDPGYNPATQVEWRGLPLHDYLGYQYSGRIDEMHRGQSSSVFCFGGCATWNIWGAATYLYHVFRKFYEDYYDYQLAWTGNWHTITDYRDQYFFEWKTQTEDVFGTVPNYATITKNVPVISQELQTIWSTENIVEQVTVFFTERIENTISGLPTAAFANESIRAGS